VSTPYFASRGMLRVIVWSISRSLFSAMVVTYVLSARQRHDVHRTKFDEPLGGSLCFA
jgi:hypothetical protein